MKLAAAFSILTDLRMAIALAVPATLWDIMKSPRLLLRPHAIPRIIMSRVWTLWGGPIDEGAREIKQSIISPNASGIVLDLGAGLGHTTKYLDPKMVTTYVALEPNTLMHVELRQIAATNGFSEEAANLVVLSCGAEDTETIASAVGRESVDAIVSILTICTIPRPRESLQRLFREILRPGGVFVFYEHVLSPRPDVAWWQRFWAPLWSLVFDGCRMDRPSYVWIEQMGIWQEGNTWQKEGEPEEHLFPHRIGRYVKV